MPQFAPGETKKAIVEMTNPTASPFDYSVTLYMGVNMVAMASASFHLEGSETKNVEISPVVMPSTEGTYPVYLDVWSNSALLGHYKAVEDVVISLPVPLAPCVYCGATFTSEAALVSHMEANHPRKPYLIYAYPQEGQVTSGDSVPIVYKLYTPAVPGTSTTDAYGITIYIKEYPVWEPYNGAFIDLRGGTPEGFYAGSATWRAAYNAGGWPPTFKNIPRGTYKLYSWCRHLDLTVSPGRIVKNFWKDVDTGLTITVV